jgi:hypothetical protein
MSSLPGFVMRFGQHGLRPIESNYVHSGCRGRKKIFSCARREFQHWAAQLYELLKPESDGPKVVSKQGVISPAVLVDAVDHASPA